jgi:hypothetical protein
MGARTADMHWNSPFRSGPFGGAQNGMIRALSGDAGHIVFARLLGRLPRWT